MSVDVLVVGAGHAGVQVAVGLARSVPSRAVRLVGEEPELPYERPALTKRLLADADPEPIALRTSAYWASSAVRLERGRRVVALDASARLAHLADGESIAYDALVWAAGGRAAAGGLPGEELRGVHSIRDFADLIALKRSLVGARRAVVVGGGYLGLEAAAGLRTLGLAVTVLELAPRLLARVTGPVVSGFFAALHCDHGVDVRTDTGVVRVLGIDGRAAGVVLRDGAVLDADVVVMAVGMRPNVEVLVAAGADGDRAGVLVDAECRTSLPDVFAAGDCAAQCTPWSASPAAQRVESVHNAGQHAAAVTRALGGLAPLDPSPPRFWSTQYGQELKTAGLPSADDEQIVRGDPSGNDFAVAYLRDGRLVALDTVNRPRDFARAQALIASHWQPQDPARLADAEFDLPRAGVPVAT